MREFANLEEYNKQVRKEFNGEFNLVYSKNPLHKSNLTLLDPDITLIYGRNIPVKLVELLVDMGITLEVILDSECNISEGNTIIVEIKTDNKYLDMYILKMKKLIVDWENNDMKMGA